MLHWPITLVLAIRSLLRALTRQDEGPVLKPRKAPTKS